MVRASAAGLSAPNAYRANAYDSSSYNRPTRNLLPSTMPTYPQRTEGNIGKQTGHVFMTYSNINHEMPHSEYMDMTPAQLTTFHNYGPPMMQPLHTWEAPAQPAPPALPAPPADSTPPAPPQEEKKDEKQDEGGKCGLCKKQGALRKFEHIDHEWVVCLGCAKEAFGAEGVRMWRLGVQA